MSTHDGERLDKGDREEMDLKTVIRDMDPGDEAFIYATWLRSLYFGNSYYNLISQDVFFEKYKRVVAALLHQARVKVSCLEDDRDTILGYSVYEHGTLHWVYVKQPWRHMGIAKSLVPSDINKFSHLTDVGKKMWPKGWEYDPFL